MTNLQEAANQRQQQLQQQLLLAAPIAAGALVATLVTAVVTVPQWLRLQTIDGQRRQLQELQQRLPLLRSQLAKTSADQQQAERRRAQVLELIEGSGDFVTFLAQLDQEAARNGLELDLFEPVAAVAPAAPAAPARGGNQAQGAAEPPPADPLKDAGLQQERVLLTVRGPYGGLLGFMRGLERLSLLVAPSNFTVDTVERPQPPQPPAAEGEPPAEPAPAATTTQLKVTLTLYRKDGSAAPAVASQPNS